MKNKKYILIFLMTFLFTLQTHAQDLLYPIWKMSKPSCRFQDYATLDADCIQDLPILRTADYSKYKNDYNVYRRVYTVLWWASYTYWWDVGNWWHSWVDIATAKWTPVRAMTDWKVVKAKTLTWRWNTVKVEHKINWRTIYSNYSHMSLISVKEWDIVKAWDKLWEVWSTWNSTWNHLHFQIDVVKAWWPRYRTKCSEKNYDKIINSPVCFSELNEATVDPLLFLETNWAIVKSSTVIEKPKQENISTVWLISNEEILKKEINEFLEKYDLKLEIQNLWSNIELWKSWILRVSVTDKLTKKPFNWNFPWTMTFKYDDKKLNVFPTWIFAIDKWIRDITVTTKQAWFQTIDVYIWQAFVTKINIGVLDPKKSITPYSTEFSIWDVNVISEIKKWSFYFKTKEWISILWSKFNWNFTLTSSDWNLKFCIKKAKTYSDIDYVNNTTCSEFDFVRDANFSYSDTTDGILLFDYKIAWSEKTKLIIKNQNWWQVGFYTITPVLPSWINTSYPYYSEMIELWKLWVITWVNKWYFVQDRELVFTDALGYIRNTLAFLKTNCKTDTCKQTINSKIESLKKTNQAKYSQIKVNRIQFTQLVKMFIPSTWINWTPVAFRDLDNNQQTIVWQVLKTYTWKDNFWQTRYFQPTKAISRGEAAYVIYNYIK